MTSKKHAVEQQKHPIEHTGQPSSVLTEGHGPEKGNAPEIMSGNTIHYIPDVQVKTGQQRAPRRRLSTAYKLKVLEEYEACDNALARGALLRREGLYASRISAWRRQRDEQKFKGKGKKPILQSRLNNQSLKRKIAQLEKDLAQAKAIIEIQKKISELFGANAARNESNEII